PNNVASLSFTRHSTRLRAGSQTADDLMKWPWEMSSVHWIGSIEDGLNAPVGDWFNVAMQFHPRPPSPVTFFVHEPMADLSVGEEWFPFTLPEGDGLLYIGTPRVGDGPHGFPAQIGTGISGFRGLVDEVRVSSVVRYDGPDVRRPRHFRPDRHTVALWTFDGNRPFNDVSWDGSHRLIPDGDVGVEALAVDSNDKLATTWGQIRSARGNAVPLPADSGRERR
ncbi:hypothetical protein CMK11_15360, partial [Candidatus Poribacteria bacterium]|nr:hypothetical protein [Candidatus Poribacteria bacterium]